MRDSLGAQTTVAWLLAAAVSLGATLALARLHDIRYLDSDATQYLSTARNLIAGDGVSTDIVYYDEQYRSASIPAPQTIFPPGLPIALAALLSMGARPDQASLWAGLIGFCATGLLLGLVLHRLRVALPFVALGTAFWCSLALAWVNVLQGRSEVLFTAFSVATLWTLSSPATSHGRLLVAGSLAAAAFSVRYQGVFFLAALGILSLLPLLRAQPNGLWRATTRAACLLAAPAAVTTLIFGRNLALLGAPGGGPVDTVRSGSGAVDAARSLYWSVSDAVGLALPEVVRGRAPELLVSIGAALLALGLLLSRPRSRAPDGAASGATRQALALATIYVAVSVIGLVYLAMTHAGAYLQGRFLVPLIPFAVVVWIVFIDRVLRASHARARWLVMAGVVTLHTGVLAAQVGVARSWLADLRADRRVAVIDAGLATPIDGVTLKDYLQQRVTARAPVFAEPGQHLWLLLERPVLSAAGAAFSAKRWTETELLRLQQCYGVEYVVFFPTLFDAALPQNANRVIFAELAAGRVPQFLEPVLRARDVEVYRLRASERVGCSAA